MESSSRQEILEERTVAGLHAALFEEITQVAGIGPAASILDLGCGSGAWLARLGAAGFKNLYGVDSEIAQCGFPNAIYSTADLNWSMELPFPDSSFDLICAIEVIEHLENPGNFLRLIGRYLRPEGYLLLTTPNIHSAIARLRFLLTGKLRQFDSKGDPTHIYPVYLPALKRLLVCHGLKIHSIWSFPGDGTVIASRFSVRLVARVLSALIPEHHAGETVCMLISAERSKR